ncbi:Hydrogenase maturation protein, carbamoyl dehydratase HypE [Caldanaerobius fijiensis DSM 17918]|uniref:Hydrogenase maturation protein, carbamoyl dehydratase HypE n=1 Tax=Caldanaerobius fijiensis DSM 17918 TaxID=1121256 RepID=A0A1M4W5H5_9THEO|nr:hydrogenase expression/formation protein HypE [Caldanaerobius fijiensis]SHE76395.1 Hydrogenase maturation protein, carbamoyl dehydratase HypE [Caldanaerobius fijiensis DSM 17918]
MERIELKHGGGGRASQDILKLFLKYFDDDILKGLEDASILNITGEIAFTTDSFVIKPRFFPGGDIGKLSICGTVNDLSARGAIPKYISVAFIIEEGFELCELEKIIMSMAETAKGAGVRIVTGDTKVVEKGKADGLYINTSGIGIVKIPGISAHNVKPKDKIIITGTIGDHGISVMAKREGLNLDVDVKSDCAPLNKVVEDLVPLSNQIHAMRDPTRGGLSATLNEIARASHVNMKIYESEIPVKDAVVNACEILGLDILTLANEGKLVIFSSPEVADDVINILKSNPQCKDSKIIGEVYDGEGIVLMETVYGTERIVDMPAGEILPRIC